MNARPTTGDPQLVADRLRGCTREPNTIAQIVGEEFATIMTRMHQPGDAAALSRRIRESIINPYQVDGHRIISDIRIGVPYAPPVSSAASHLSRNAFARFRAS